MDRRRALATVAAVAVGAPVIAVSRGVSAQQAPSDPPVAAAPRLRVGDQWVYRRLDAVARREAEEIVRVTTFDTGRRLLIESTNAPDLRGTRPFDAGMARRQQRRDPATFEPLDADVVSGSLPLLVFPLRDGALWRYSRRSRVPGGEELEDGEGEVVGFEPVEVPAGRFDAFRVRHRSVAVVTHNPAFRRVTTIELWYAARAKRWVRFDFDARAEGGGAVRAERFRLELSQFDVEPD